MCCFLGVQKYNKLLRKQIFFVFFNPTGFCFFFLFGRAGAAAGNASVIAHSIKCRRAVGLSALMILAYSAADDRRWRNLRLATTRIPAKIISASIPHAGTSDPTPVSQRATHTLVSTFSRAAIILRAVLPHTALLRRLFGVNKILSLRDCSRKSVIYYFYQALAPDGATQGKL